MAAGKRLGSGSRPTHSMDWFWAVALRSMSRKVMGRDFSDRPFPGPVAGHPAGLAARGHNRRPMPAFTARQILLLIALTLIWGINWPVMKLGVQHFPPLSFRMASMWVGLPILAAFVVWRRLPLAVPPPPGDRGRPPPMLSPHLFL